MGFSQGQPGSIHDMAGFGNCEIKKVAGSFRDMLCDTIYIECSDVNGYTEFGVWLSKH